MVEFSDCLLQMGLFDLRYQGMFNTWMNKQPDLPIAKKLDRLLVNQAWINSFPSSSTLFLPHDFSDHTLCVLDLAMPLPISGTKPFKFFNYLTKHPKFLVAVEEAWVAAGSIATSLAELRWKLKSIKGVLKSINSINFSKIQESIIIANRLLLDV
ncbi:BnaC08g46360D [Brassica napus]|uniref:BnaC08g46360D protein n=1 Tax=Brassica napus TaxID=3708 RepID=A0A078IYN6_BRANA|nr:BnaC08g46360D [Brassica napus]